MWLALRDFCAGACLYSFRPFVACELQEPFWIVVGVQPGGVGSALFVLPGFYQCGCVCCLVGVVLLEDVVFIVSHGRCTFFAWVFCVGSIGDGWMRARTWFGLYWFGAFACCMWLVCLRCLCCGEGHARVRFVAFMIWRWC